MRKTFNMHRDFKSKLALVKTSGNVKKIWSGSRFACPTSVLWHLRRKSAELITDAECKTKVPRNVLQTLYKFLLRRIFSQGVLIVFLRKWFMFRTFKHGLQILPRLPSGIPEDSSCGDCRWFVHNCECVEHYMPVRCRGGSGILISIYSERKTHRVRVICAGWTDWRINVVFSYKIKNLNKNLPDLRRELRPSLLLTDTNKLYRGSFLLLQCCFYI